MLNKLLFRIWPPYEAKMADSEIARRNREIGDDARWEAILNEIRGLLPKGADFEDLEKNAKEIQEAELKRKDTVENKATSFISSVGIGIAIISVVPALFADTWKIPKIWAIIAGISFLIAILLLLISVYYAVKVRLVKGFAVPCADSFKEMLKDDGWKYEERIVMRIAMTKWNEDTLNQKTNYLSVAENMFLRGLALIAFAVIICISGKIITC